MSPQAQPDRSPHSSAAAHGEGPYLSLVIPTFNKEHQAPRLLDSILAGSDSADLEVIVVDDGSTDGTVRVVSAFPERDGRVAVVRMERNSGVHAARNAGMRRARGKWIGFIDGDDYLSEGGLEIILGSLKELEPRYEMVFFPYRASDSGEKTGYVREGEFDIASVLSGDQFRREKNCVGFVRRALLERSGAAWYYSNLDHLFWRELELRARNGTFFFVDREVGTYDKGTAGSLGKLRRRPEYFLRHANPKIEAVASFLGRMRSELRPYSGYGLKLIAAMIRDFKYARNKGRYVRGHLGIMRAYGAGPALYLRYVLALAVPARVSLFAVRCYHRFRHAVRAPERAPLEGG